MKRKKMAAILAVCLSVSMAVPTQAAGWGSISSWLSRFKSSKQESSWSSGSNSNTSKTTSTTTDSGSDSAVALTLVEDESTVEDGTVLRASTYATTDSNTTIKYYPVTLYDYDADLINAVTRNTEGTPSWGSTWNGIYFNNGTPSDYNYRSYAKWNYWTGNVSGATGNYTYSGLVKDTLDANKNIQFNVTEPGLFTTDAVSGKTVYTNVGLPFVYDATKQEYKFDSSTMGAYFSDGASSNTNLTYSKTAQSNGGGYGDGSTTVWMPFNNTTSINGESNCDYHFGMNATIPFTMTTNGRLNESNNDSTPITFEFSGDDDVWVFIDGKLVLDIGGIHNCMGGKIDFANNTWSISKGEGNTNGGTVGDVNGKDLSGNLFNDGTTTGVLNMIRETFAAQSSHDLTIFYLERGAGSSNCKIKFNLPLKDYVSVQKLITESKTEDGEVSPLTTAEQNQVNNVDFGFTLYKDGAVVKNTTYNLVNANGQTTSSPSTDANGHFTLKNGETAKFIGEISSTGSEYYVVEDQKDGYQKPDYTASGKAANGITYDPETSSVSDLTSMKVTAKGSTENEDYVSFVCENYLDANLPNPYFAAQDDKIVIDYGLKVNIPDVLANDTWKGESIKLDKVEGAQYGTATINNDGTISYQLTKQLSGVEVLTYTATVTGTGNSGTTTTTETKTGTGKIYIIPATSMYYEENFSNLVSYSGSWSDVGSATNDVQEPGVVGTVGDSPYGSDDAYLDDSTDSNGTSKYVSTANGSASFSYTFTGTGTSIFARTTNDSAYMRVTIVDKDGNQVYQGYRDTRYKQADANTTKFSTLYNVPVFTWNADNYGTYTVKAAIAKKTSSYGSEFYLDGIRVQNPMVSGCENWDVASGAYAADSESNMRIATVRQKLLNEAVTTDKDGNLIWSEGDGFVVFTDTNGEVKLASEYQSNGPKEEVYLNEGQSITFALKGYNKNNNDVYLGIKAPVKGSKVTIGSTSLNINNAADCYYNIEDYGTVSTDADGNSVTTFEITATSGLISVTNIKVTGDASFVITEEMNVDGQNLDEDSIDNEEQVVEQLFSDDTNVTEPAGTEETAEEASEETEEQAVKMDVEEDGTDGTSEGDVEFTLSDSDNSDTPEETANAESSQGNSYAASDDGTEDSASDTLTD